MSSKKNRVSTTSLVPWIIGIVIVSFIVLLPFFRPGFFVTDDGDWMIIRLSAFTHALRDGQFPTRFLGRLNQNYGYPVANFLYPGFMYVGSVIHALGVPYVETVKLIMGGSVLIGAFAIFFWLQTQFAFMPSFFGALGYILAPYLLYDIYVRGSVGEIFAMAAAAVSLYAIGAGKRLLLPIAIAVLITGHNTMALLLLPIIGVYAFIDKKRGVILLIGLGVGLAAFFWIPALFERSYVWFDAVAVAKPWEYFLRDGWLWLINPVALSACVFVFLERKKNVSGLAILAFVGIFVTLCTTALATPLWHIDLLGKIIQFPYRLLAVTTLIGPWIIAWTATSIHMKRVFAFAWIVLWLIPVSRMLPAIVFTNQPEGFYTTNEATTTVADEYMPRWVKAKPARRAESKVEFIAGHGEIAAMTATGRHVKATVNAAENSMIQINTVYYPGWGVQVDGRPVSVSYNNPLGVMRVSVPQGVHTIYADFRETILRFAADVVTMGALLFWVGMALKDTLGKKRT